MKTNASLIMNRIVVKSFIVGTATHRGKYRNLFVEAGHSPLEVSAKINAVFQQLFHGNPNIQAVYFPAGTNVNGALAYVTDIGSRDGAPGCPLKNK